MQCRTSLLFSPGISVMKTLRYARRLVGFESTSRLSNRLICKYLQMKLVKHGFEVEKLEYRDPQRVRKVNLVAKKGSGQGGLAYFAHTDTVPADDWHSQKYGPWEPEIARERLYGRGSCDMKGSIACMLTASRQFQRADLKQPLYLVFTADEEVGFHGARHVVSSSRRWPEMVEAQTRGIVGEPTALEIVHAHKGMCIIRATSRGKAAHSSTALGKNANLAMIPFLAEMRRIHDELENDARWQDCRFDPPTLSWNIVIHDSNRAANVTSPETTCSIYTRPIPGIDIQPLLERTRRCAAANGLEIEIFDAHSAFHTDTGNAFLQEALKLTHRSTPATVSYGTDAGVLGDLQNLIVCGPGSIAQAHTRDEWISIEQLTLGNEMYTRMIERWCCS
jgi:acetylornithine deacetylase